MKKPGLADLDMPLNRTGYVHIAFSVGSKEKVDELMEKLRTAGYEVSHFWKKNHFEVISEADVNGWPKLVAERKLRV